MLLSLFLIYGVVISAVAGVFVHIVPVFLVVVACSFVVACAVLAALAVLAVLAVGGAMVVFAVLVVVCYCCCS